MDTDIKIPNICTINTLKDSLDTEKIEAEEAEEEEEDEDEKNESSSLLSPRKGGISKKRSKKTRRKVQWNDKDGDNLVEILEFQPSDSSDTDEEDSDSCICTIM
ncbi:hypothetical protein C5167_041372 [Papaver somniferum]|uniref:ribosome quality control complex subunit 2-like n=1 Tax=Papaver somniferum TaxID=3469 RepID=UPI000E6F738F|nr:ribosome quality control complex subunit 2-like [Papaver somniferum]RZC87321.1 hypothetical protein C5167_041372 [Papaver somniferum]